MYSNRYNFTRAKAPRLPPNAFPLIILNHINLIKSRFRQYSMYSNRYNDTRAKAPRLPPNVFPLIILNHINLIKSRFRHYSMYTNPYNFTRAKAPRLPSLNLIPDKTLGVRSDRWCAGYNIRVLDLPWDPKKK